MSNLLPHLVQLSFASACLDVVKMKAFVPCEVEDDLNAYKTKIVEIVFDPLKINVRLPQIDGHRVTLKADENSKPRTCEFTQAQSPS